MFSGVIKVTCEINRNIGKKSDLKTENGHAFLFILIGKRKKFKKRNER